MLNLHIQSGHLKRPNWIITLLVKSLQYFFSFKILNKIPNSYLICEINVIWSLSISRISPHAFLPLAQLDITILLSEIFLPWLLVQIAPFYPLNLILDGTFFERHSLTSLIYIDPAIILYHPPHTDSYSTLVVIVCLLVNYFPH